MGTQVQCKNYLPGYYSMRDLNVDSNNGSWSPYYEDNMLKNGQYYNGFTSRPVDEYSECNKEVLKRTMLSHEAIFKKQVHELHRLCRKQKDLMDELKKKELYNHSVTVGTSQSSQFLSQMPSEDTEKMWQIHSLPSVNSSYSRPSISGTNNIRCPLDLIKENTMQASSTPTENGGSLKDGEILDSRLSKFPRRTFDLQLPADEYIDNEDGEQIKEEEVLGMPLRTEYSLNKNCGGEPDRYVKLALGTGGSRSCVRDGWKPDSHIHNNLLTHSLADLNEPIIGICSDKAESSASFNFLGPLTCRNDTQGQQLAMKPSSNFLGLPRDLFLDKLKVRDPGNCSGFSHSEEEGTRWEWQSYSFEPGQNRRSTANSLTPIFCHEKLSTSSEPIQVELKQARVLPPFLLSDQNKSEMWSRGKATSCTEILKKGLVSTNSNYSGSVAPSMPGPISNFPHSDVSNTAASLVSSWRKPINGISHIPVAVQALPCFENSVVLSTGSKSSNLSFQSPNTDRDKLHVNGHSRSFSSFGRELPCQNGFNHGFQSSFSSISSNKVNPANGEKNFEDHGPKRHSKGLYCPNVKSAKELNLNLALPDEFEDGVNPQGDNLLVDGERKHDDSSEGMSWLRTKPSSNDSKSLRGGLTQIGSGFPQGHTQLMSSRDTVKQQFERETEMEKGPICFMPDVMSTTETVDNPCNKKILGFPLLLDKPRLSEDQSALSKPSILHWNRSEIDDTRNGIKDGLLQIDLSCDPTSPNSEKNQLFAENQVADKWVDKSRMGLRDHINLNSTAEAYEEQPNLSNTSKNEAEDPSSSSISRVFIEIGLEVPIISEVAESILLGAESLGSNQLATPTQLPGCKEVDPDQAFVRAAAEAIVAMSSDTCNQSVTTTCTPSITALRDSLSWFAEVISSNASDLQSTVIFSKGKVNIDGEMSEDGVDFFESMTLKLSETKMDEFLYIPREQEDQETGASPLLTPPQRGRRRRRQRRDFQKDILPGLVSLARHEVTEDLQMIGGMMRASGFSWDMGLTRKNVGRNGWKLVGPARGRRRSRGIVSSPPPSQPTHEESELVGRNLKGWGKTTRRCRSQRFPMSNAPAAALT